MSHAANLAWIIVGAVVGVSALVSLVTFFCCSKAKKASEEIEHRSVYQAHGQEP